MQTSHLSDRHPGKDASELVVHPEGVHIGGGNFFCARRSKLVGKIAAKEYASFLVSKLIPFCFY